jgi:hypothetical protein
MTTTTSTAAPDEEVDASRLLVAFATKRVAGVSSVEQSWHHCQQLLLPLVMVGEEDYHQSVVACPTKSVKESC